MDAATFRASENKDDVQYGLEIQDVVEQKWDDCPAPLAGRLVIDVDFARPLIDLKVEEWELFLAKLAEQVEQIFHGNPAAKMLALRLSEATLPFGEGTITFKPSPPAGSAAEDAPTLANTTDNVNTNTCIIDETSRQVEVLPQGSEGKDERAKAAFRAVVDRAVGELTRESVAPLETVLAGIDRFRGAVQERLQAALREFIRSQTTGDYGAKQEVVAVVNAALNRLGMAIRFQDQACYVATTVGDEYPRGRFLIVPKGSKKPLLTRIHLADLPLLELMDAVQSEPGNPSPAADESTWADREASRRSGGSPSHQKKKS
jgi:hypothetical protein